MTVPLPNELVPTPPLPAVAATGWPGIIGRLASWSEHHPVSFALAIVLIGLALRLPHFADRDLWYDEIIQECIVSGGPLAELGTRLRDFDRYPPAFSVAGWFVSQLTDSQARLRFVSLAAGLGAIALAWAVGRSAFGHGCAVVAGLLVAASPVQTFFSREARPVELGVFSVFLLLATITHVIRKPRWRSGVACAFAAALVPLSQYTGTVVGGITLSLAMAWVAWRPGRRRPVLVPLAAALATMVIVSLIMYFAFVREQVRLQGTGGNFLAGNFYDIRNVAEVVPFAFWSTADFFSFLSFGGNPGGVWRMLATVLVAFPVVLALVVRPRDFAWLGWSVLASIVALVALAGVGVHPYGGIRHVLALSPLLVVCVAAGLGQLRMRGTQGAIAADVALITILFLAAIGHTKFIPDLTSQDVSGLVADVSQSTRDGDALVVVGNHYCLTFPYHATHDSRTTYAAWDAARQKPTELSEPPLKLFGCRTLLLAVDDDKIDTAFRAIAPGLPATGRIWVVNASRLGEPLNPSRAGSTYRLVTEVRHRGCRAYCWEPVSTSR